MSGDIELVDPKTGELIHFRPTNPVEMEYIITELSDAIEALPEKLKEINERRYTAERNYSRKRNTQLALYCDERMPVTAARARAEIDALPELEALHQAKAEYHYADDLLRALTSRLSGLCNVNKGVQQAYQHYGRGR